MWDSLSQISALSVFLVLAAIGFLFLLISFLFGEILGFLEFEHEFEHEFGDEGPSFFSLRVIAVFVTAFGGIGAIGIYRGYSTLISSMFGLASGVVTGAVVYFFARLLYSQQASSMVDASDLIGVTAQVIVRIPSEGFGQVRCVVGESMIDKLARSRGGVEIPNNSTVRIEEIAGESVIVSPCPAEGEGKGLFLFTND